MTALDPTHLRALLSYLAEKPEGENERMLPLIAHGPGGWLAPKYKPGMRRVEIVREAAQQGLTQNVRVDGVLRTFITDAGRAFLAQA